MGSLLAPLSFASAQTAPAAPTITSAVAGDGQVTLSWIAGDAGGARVTRWEYTQSTPATNLWVPIPGSGPGTFRHTITGLNSGGPNRDGQSGYRFRVRAVSSAGNGQASAESEAAVPSAAPAAPAGLRATAGNSQVALAWTAAAANTAATGFSPILRYEYRQKTGGGDYAPWAIVVDSGAATAGHVVTGLVNGTAYQFQVRAVNANGPGASAESEPVTAAAPPGPPRSLRAEPGDKMATLLWTASSDGGSPVTGWQFRRGEGSAGIADSAAWVTIPDSNAATTSYTVLGLENDGQVYRFEVRAVNEVGPGSGAVTEPVDPGRIPFRPTGVTASFKEGTTDTVSLAWTPPSDGGSPIIGYQYSQQAGSGGYGAWQDIPDAVPETSSFDVTGLTSRTAYRFRVRAVNGVGGGTSSAATSPVYPGTSPSAPGSLRVANSYDAADGTREVVLRWTPGDDGGSPVTGWEYNFTADAANQAGLYDDEGWVPICDTTVRADAGCGSRTSVSLPRTSAALARLGIASGPDGPELVPVAGETYLVVVRAVNQHGNGLVSGVAATTIPRIVPTTPPAVYFQDAAQNSFRVWWPASTDGGANANIPGTDTTLRYQLSYQTAGDPWTPWRNEAGNTAVIESAMEGARYRVRVRAENAVGHSGVAESATYTHGGPPTPGADVVDAVPVLSATAAAGEVALSLARSANTGSIGGITETTQWEHSYKVGTEDWVGWTFNNAGHWFDGVTVDSLEGAEPHTFRIRGVNGGLAGPSLESKAVVLGFAPHSPFGLMATGGDRSVVLTWTSPDSGPPATRWQVCQKNNANPCGDVDTGEGWSDIADSGPDTTSHIIENLANGTAYTFLVRAWNNAVRGARAQADPATPGTPPDAPPRVQAMAGDRQITLIVTAPRDDQHSRVTSYLIRRQEVGGDYGEWETTARAGTETATTAVAANLTNGVSYTLEVRAVNAYGPGTAAQLGPFTPLGPPPGGTLRAEPGDARVVLNWLSGGDGGLPITGWEYRWQRTGSVYGAWRLLEGSGPDTAAHTATGLDNGIAYTFQVRAVNVLGAGDSFEAGPVTPATVPPPPVELTATRSDGQVALAWRAGVSGAPGEADYAAPTTGWQYRVRAGDSGYGEWADVADRAAASAVVEGLVNGVPYEFEVRAVSDLGAGPAATASVVGGSVPGAPSVAARGTRGEITVSWTAGDDGGSPITGWQYRMRVSIGGYGDWTELAADAVSVTVDDLGGGTGVLSYTFQVRAVNGVGEGAAGTSNEAMPVAGPSAGGEFYSGVVTGPDFCADMSLGGARLFAHDSSGDGVADVCSLPYTRREAIARQIAVEALVNQHLDEYAALVNEACAVTEGEAVCGGDMLASPPPVPINDGGEFYSGVVTGPTFCANRSLGGPTTYPHDDDKDGVAEVCALPYARREAIARQLAGDVLAATRPADFRRELASACRGLTGADYGDSPVDLAADACA